MIQNCGKLNLGCGQELLKGYINIDNRAEVCPNVCCDIIRGLPFADNSIDYVRAHDFLEHIPLGQTVKVIEDVWRVLRHGGKFDSSTPDAEYGGAAFQDPYHLSFWVKNSWRYYSDDSLRSLYGIKAKFKIDNIVRVPELSPNMDIYHIQVMCTAIKE